MRTRRPGRRSAAPTGTAALLGLLAAVSLGLAACAGGGGPAATPTCSPHGTTLSIVAQNVQFNRSCLAVPADTPFVVEVDNQDGGVPHNFSIYDSQGGRALFKGQVFTGPASRSEHVQGLPPGTYYFQCDVHPGMNGVLIVK